MHVRVSLRTLITGLAILGHGVYWAWCERPHACDTASFRRLATDRAAASNSVVYHECIARWQARGLLDTATVLSDQSVTLNVAGDFNETFRRFTNTSLSGHDLRPDNGSCSLSGALPAPVLACAAQNNLCCLNASELEVCQ